MKVVIDTNVFVSSFFGGNPRKIVNLWREGSIVLCLSNATLDEYVGVLQEMGLEETEELEELLALFARGYNLRFIANPQKFQVVDDDPDDDKFIEVAVALRAKAIITGDKALKAIKAYMGITIFTPREFLDFYNRQN
ncbi:MAG: PIN domain-containing protein [Nitrospirales bacterium]|nr:MAG: PIN domain-containing protein [Nitrospirales bacterium]